jgi:hypothetical protein
VLHQTARGFLRIAIRAVGGVFHRLPIPARRNANSPHL